MIIKTNEREFQIKKGALPEYCTFYHNQDHKKDIQIDLETLKKLYK